MEIGVLRCIIFLYLDYYDVNKFNLEQSNIRAFLNSNITENYSDVKVALN